MASSSASQITELSDRLVNEKIYAQSERDQIKKLNQEAALATARVFQRAWLVRQQKNVLSSLAVDDPSICCLKANRLDSTKFEDAFVHLDYHEAKFSSVLKELRDNLPVTCDFLLYLSHNQRLDKRARISILETFMSSIYGSCITTHDELQVSRMLKLLAERLLSYNQPVEPHRAIIGSRTSGVWCQMFKLFTDSLYSCKIFLSAALSEPIISLLTKDEWFYDLDPSNILERFTQLQRVQKFGEPGTENYRLRTGEYRHSIVIQLHTLTEHFIKSIRHAAHICFPYPIRWILSHLWLTLVRQCPEEQARLICTELLFDHFICPAITDPLVYGLTSDVTVSHIARHNLNQVGRAVQVLSKRDETERGRVSDFYSRFDVNCLTTVVDSILISNPPETIEMERSDSLNRGVVFIGLRQLAQLVSLLRDYSSTISETEHKPKFDELVSTLPIIPILEEQIQTTPDVISTPTHSPQIKPIFRSTLRISPHKGTTSNKKKHGLSTKHRTFTPDSPSQLINQQQTIPDFKAQNVIAITINDTEPIGMTEEEKVMKQIESDEGQTDQASRLEGSIKRTRFYIEHDQESLGNTSEYPSEYQPSEFTDAISEAASVASARSERSTNLDDNDDVDDNLSDMVSANVSGRGSPNISGRDTPQSSGGGGPLEGRQPQVPPTLPASLPVTVNKPGGSDLTDRFGKFDITTRGGQTSVEVGSVVSDSWSIDVYPDSETAESAVENDRASLPPQNVVNNQNLPQELQSVRDQETTSESAWSTDVLNSDTSERPSERIRELEMIEEPLRTPATDQGSESDSMSVRSDVSRRAEPSSPFAPVTGGLLPNGTLPNNNSSNQLYTPAFQPFSNNTSTSNNTGEMMSPSMSGGINHSSNSQFTSTYRTTDILQPTPRTAWNGPSSNSQPGSVLDMFDPLNNFHSHSQSQTASYNITSQSQTTSYNVTSHSQTTSRSGTVPAVDNPDPWGESQRSSSPNTSWNNIDVTQRPPTWNSNNNRNNDGLSMRNTIVPTQRAQQSYRRWAVLEEDGRPMTWATAAEQNSTRQRIAVSSTNNIGSAICTTSRSSVISVTTAAQGASQGAIPKERNTSGATGGSVSEDGDNFIQPARKIPSKRYMPGFLSRKSNKSPNVSGKNSPRSDNTTHLDLRDAESAAAVASSPPGAALQDIVNEEPEDLLEKFRSKGREDSNPIIAPPSSPDSTESPPDEDTTPLYDPKNLEKCRAFIAGKKKLRLVLSNPELVSSTLLSRYSNSYNQPIAENPLMPFLRSLYAEAVYTGNIQHCTQIQETLRCISQFDESGCKRLLRAVRQEYQSRIGFITYLVRSRQQLLAMNSRLSNALTALSADNTGCFESLISECVRLYLNKKEVLLNALKDNFERLQAVDEKTEAVEKCLTKLINDMCKDMMWSCSSESMQQQAQIHIERIVMERVYKLAMFPLGDVDRQRDKIFSDNLYRLSQNITPSHKKLRIPSIYHLEAPWKSAQNHLIKINAFKTPREKVQCVCNCVTTISGLLKIAHSKTVPAADDLLPVFIYVLIQANPDYLLSTINFVEGLYVSKMQGEEAYYWNQLSAAVNFIKMWIHEELQSNY